MSGKVDSDSLVREALLIQLCEEASKVRCLTTPAMNAEKAEVAFSRFRGYVGQSSATDLGVKV